MARRQIPRWNSVERAVWVKSDAFRSGESHSSRTVSGELSPAVGPGPSADSERVVVDRGLEEVQEKGAEEEEEARGLGETLVKQWRLDLGQCRGRRLSPETCGFIGRCPTKPSVKRKNMASRTRGSSRIQEQEYASLFFVCLFVCQKKNLTGIV